MNQPKMSKANVDHCLFAWQEWFLTGPITDGRIRVLQLFPLNYSSWFFNVKKIHVDIAK